MSPVAGCRRRRKSASQVGLPSWIGGADTSVTVLATIGSENTTPSTRSVGRPAVPLTGMVAETTGAAWSPAAPQADVASSAESMQVIIRRDMAASWQETVNGIASNGPARFGAPGRWRSTDFASATRRGRPPEASARAGSGPPFP